MPQNSNTSSSEASTYIPELSSYAEPTDFSFMKNWVFAVNNSSPDGRALVDCSDALISQPPAAQRNSSSNWSTVATSGSTLSKFLVNSTDWYVGVATPSSSNPGVAYYMGTTEPDLDS